MSARTTRRSTDGTQTRCPKCDKPVRGEKGLKAHLSQCSGTPIARGGQTPKGEANVQQ